MVSNYDVSVRRVAVDETRTIALLRFALSMRWNVTGRCHYSSVGCTLVAESGLYRLCQTWWRDVYCCILYHCASAWLTILLDRCEAQQVPASRDMDTYETFSCFQTPGLPDSE